MAEGVLISISLIIGIVAVLTILARIIKQPPIIAYLIAGIIVGPAFLGYIDPASASTEIIQMLASIGIAFLLFIVGLSLDFRVLKDFGKISALTGIGQIIITSALIFLVALGLGFQKIPALYIGVAFAFSSTVVVVKILSDKREMDTLHGRIALGFLIFQDIIAAIALMVIPVIQDQSIQLIMLQLGKTILLISAIFIFTTFIMTKLLFYLAKNQEVLFIFGIAWALIIATLFDILGLSLEIGALIAGMSLASSKYTLELGGKMKPLRDFFVVLFFVYFGSLFVPPISTNILKNALIFSAIVFIGIPIIMMTLMKFAGYKKRTSFLTGFGVAQISEFSLILILLGFNLGHISQDIVDISILTALITISLSSYSIYHSESVFKKISPLLSIFDGRKNKSKEKLEKEKSKNHDVVLFGYHRIGGGILKTLKKMKYNFIVVDYNPSTIDHLTNKGINCIYGDANDEEFIEELKLSKVKMVISTIPHVESNIVIKDRLKEVESDAVFIATANHLSEAIKLYKEGIDYVIMPHILGGEYASELIRKNKLDIKKYKKIAEENLKDIKKKERIL